MAKFAVILPAAGAGSRFGGAVRKPFAQLEGRPIFVRCIELFLSRSDLVQTLLAVSPGDYDVVREKYAANLMFMGVKVVKGGAERHESVRLALEQVDAAADFVCVHDAVRPCVLPEWIDRVFAAAVEHGAAILAAPLVGTIKRVLQQRVEQTIPREGLFEAQTPQVFRVALLREAYARLPAGVHPTDDAEVVERIASPVAIVETDRRNIKITTPGDMVMAETVLRDFSRQVKRAPAMGSPFDEAQW